MLHRVGAQECQDLAQFLAGPPGLQRVVEAVYRIVQRGVLAIDLSVADP